MTFAGFLHRVCPAPTAEENQVVTTVTPARHARTKRCSCASFLDKECVYFCHLDIIWVNTPERVVSYGLGNAPRRKRAVKELAVTAQDSRCKCAREDDRTCMRFCQRENHRRREAVPDIVIHSAEGDDCSERQCKQRLAAKTGWIRRMKDKIHRQPFPSPALTATLKTRLLLENWREKRRHKAKAREDEVVASNGIQSTQPSFRHRELVFPPVQNLFLSHPLSGSSV